MTATARIKKPVFVFLNAALKLQYLCPLPTVLGPPVLHRIAALGFASPDEAASTDTAPSLQPLHARFMVVIFEFPPPPVWTKLHDESCCLHDVRNKLLL